MIIQTIGKLRVANGKYKTYAVGGHGFNTLDALNDLFAQCDYLDNLIKNGNR